MVHWDSGGDQRSVTKEREREREIGEERKRQRETETKVKNSHPLITCEHCSTMVTER